MSDEIKECPKCHYIRQPGDTAPAGECPKCGVIYTKAMIRHGKNGPTIPASWKTQEENIKASEPINTPIRQNEVAEQAAMQPPPKNLIDCQVCGKPLSYQAQSCPSCGHPNPDAPRTAGLIAGVIAITLGVVGALMPYFAAVFLVPAAFAAAAVTAILRMHALAAIALIPAFVGVLGIYQTSKQIREAQVAIEKSALEMQIEAAKAQSRAREQMEQLQKQFRNY